MLKDFKISPVSLLSILIFIFCILIFLLKIIFYILNGSHLDHVAGAWCVLAWDLSDGLFYRPLYSDATGYGGTRFMPLFFSLHALVIKLTGNVIRSGHWISIGSAIFFFLICTAILKELKVKPLLAIIFPFILLSTATFQQGLSTIRGDILPLGFNLLGILFYIREGNHESNSSVIKYRSLLFFIFALCTKITAFHGIGTIIVCLLIRKRWNEILKVIIIFTGGLTLSLLALNLLSDGRFFNILYICASGGTSLSVLMKMPIRFSETIISDPGTLVIFFMALTILYKINYILKLNIIEVFFIISLLITITLFGSPGIWTNHLVDLSTASMLVIGNYYYAAKDDSSVQLPFQIIILLAMLMLHSYPILKSEIQLFKYKPIDAVNNKVTNLNGVIISENPIHLIRIGKKPFMMDSFMLRIAMKHDSTIQENIIHRLSEQSISAVILENDPAEKVNFYKNLNFGNTFMDALEVYYSKYPLTTHHVIYLPMSNMQVKQ